MKTDMLRFSSLPFVVRRFRNCSILCLPGCQCKPCPEKVMVRLAADTHTARGKRHRRTVINNIVNRHGWLAKCFEMRLIRTIRRQCIGKRGTTVQQRLQFGVSLGVEITGKDEGFICRDASDPIQ